MLQLLALTFGLDLGATDSRLQLRQFQLVVGEFSLPGPNFSICTRRSLSSSTRTLHSANLRRSPTCRNPLASNSVTRRLMSWLLRRFRTYQESKSGSKSSRLD